MCRVLRRAEFLLRSVAPNLFCRKSISKPYESNESNERNLVFSERYSYKNCTKSQYGGETELNPNTLLPKTQYTVKCSFHLFFVQNIWTNDLSLKYRVIDCTFHKYSKTSVPASEVYSNDLIRSPCTDMPLATIFHIFIAVFNSKLPL